MGLSQRICVAVDRHILATHGAPVVYVGVWPMVAVFENGLQPTGCIGCPIHLGLLLS
jgi:hypothetical protein